MRLLRARSRVLTIVSLVLVASSCYRLAPIEGASPTAGQEVRLSLSDEGSVRLAPLIGPRIEAIDGRTVQATDTAFVVAVEAVVTQAGRSMAWSMERLTVPRSAVSSIRTRTLDRKKSWIVAGLGVIGAIALGDVFGLGTGFGGFLGVGDGGGKR
jgi:hypothetical protein